MGLRRIAMASVILPFSFALTVKHGLGLIALLLPPQQQQLHLRQKRTVFGDVGEVGHLVQNLVGVELILDHVPRQRLNEMVEIVQDPEVTANVAIDNLVQF